MEAAPRDIAIDPEYDRLYVVFHYPYTISVIDTKAPALLADLPSFEVRTPNSIIQNITIGVLADDIAIDSDSNRLYLIDFNSNKLSIVDPFINNQSLQVNVSVGIVPADVAVNPNTNKIYVSNSYSGTVSVIDGETNKIISNVTVGSSPQRLAIDPNTNRIYVTNYDSDTISVIDGYTDRLLAGVTFGINPSISTGHIICNNENIATYQYIRINSETKCIAEANTGFQFGSWVENFGHNSTRTISTSNLPSDSLLGLIGFNPKDNASIWNVDHYGNFTAYFKEIAPPIPPEFWIPLYGIIVSTIIGWSIPSIIGWVKAKREIRRLYDYHKEINSLYDDGKLDDNDIQSLERLRRSIANAYAKGNIDEQHFTSLKSELSTLYEEICNKRIESLGGLSSEEGAEILDLMRRDITNAYAKGTINELHYNLIGKKISEYENNHHPQ